MPQQNVCRSLEFGEEGRWQVATRLVTSCTYIYNIIQHGNFRRPKIVQIKQFHSKDFYSNTEQVWMNKVAHLGSVVIFLLKQSTFQFLEIFCIFKFYSSKIALLAR